MAKNNKDKYLFEKLIELDTPSTLNIENNYHLPDYLKNNISNNLRKYQDEALRYLHYTQRTPEAKSEFKHLMFNMATGAGKTMVLAAAMLYFFKEHGYQNFLFFVHSNAIVEKTKENLLNPLSSKYLFSNPIEIDGNRLTIKEVINFPINPEKNTIYLKLSTINKIHDELNSYKENGLTYDDLEETALILLGDEAHHFNAATKGLSKTNKEEAASWEKTIKSILNSNRKNKLLEFTATLNLETKEIKDKYQNKIVYKYDLKKFMLDGFSKRVMLLEANQDDNDKMLDAVLLSQYRKLIALNHGIKGFKPLILFKSNKIDISKNKEDEFIHMIENLSPQFVKEYLLKKQETLVSKTSVWNKVIKYYLSKELSFIDVINSIQEDFDARNLLNANKKDFLESDPIILNSLEDINNPIRAIFAVAKLNEGWDVLNLYDIVRISETATSTKGSTDSEAQLIGRGARYYPFEYNGKTSFTRRYDNVASDLNILEQLHYHTINDKSYIKTLHKSLDQADIIAETDGQLEMLSAKVKNQFKETDLFKRGKLFYNKTIEIADEERNLESYSLDKIFTLEYKGLTEESLEKFSDETSVITKIETLKLDKRFFHKAMQRIDFYKFNNIKHFLPKVRSLNEFITSEKYLGGITIDVTLPESLNVNDLPPKIKLSFLEKVLLQIASTIQRNYFKNKGTYEFVSKDISSLVEDYNLYFSPQYMANQTITQRIQSRSMTGKSWFVFDNAIANQLEHRLIDLIGQFMPKLREKYKDIYLIRNDEKSMRFKLTEFNGVRGFMPDFLLLLTDKVDGSYYQVFLEPKGDDRLEDDAWKERMLEEINDQNKIVIIDENDNARLVGLKFFADSKQVEFIKDMEFKLYNGNALKDLSLNNELFPGEEFELYN